MHKNPFLAGWLLLFLFLSISSGEDMPRYQAEIINLIKSGKTESAQKNIDDFVAKYSREPNLPDALYWIGRNFGWSNKYEEEKKLYIRIMQEHPDCQKTNKARLGFSRAQVNSLVMTGKYNEAKTAFEKLTSDFSNHPDLHDTLNSIAKRWIWAGNYQEAKNVYQQIADRYPGTDYAAKAKVYVQAAERGIKLFSLIDADKTTEAQNEIKIFAGDFNGHDLLAQTIMLCGEKYSAKGFQKEATLCKTDLQTALDIWKQIIEDLPPSTTTPYAYYHSAICYQRIGNYQKAVEYYKKITDDYSDFEMAWDAQFKTGYTYKQMLNAGMISRQNAKPLIASAYKKVLERYPDCKAAKLAEKWLEINDN